MSTDPVSSAPRIDSHHHLWDLDVRDQPWTRELPVLRRSFSYADLLPHLEQAGVSGTVVVQTVSDADETPELLAIADEQPRLLGVVGWVDLTGPDVAGELSRLRELPGGDTLVAVRHQVQLEPDPEWLLRDDVEAGLRAVSAAGLVHDVVVTSDQLPAVVESARRLPDLPMVLDHAGKPPIATGDGSSDWRDSVVALGKLSHVACKLSGLVTEAAEDWDLETLAPYADLVLESFGPDHVMLGSDWPVCLLRGSYDEVTAAHDELVAGLSPDERSRVQGGTAIDWYGLTGPGVTGR